jgi:hypothetical protein
MPQNTAGPVALAAMITIRLQTIVSREVASGDTAVATVGSSQAGTRNNVIPDFAVMELNVRSKIPDAVGVPYCYWALGFIDRDTYLAAKKDSAWRTCPPTTRRSSCLRFSPPCGPAPRR